MKDSTRIRSYNVTGTVITSNTTPENYGERVPDDFTVHVDFLRDATDSTELALILGTRELNGLNKPPRLIFDKEHIDSFVDAIQTLETGTIVVDGKIYAVDTPVTSERTKPIPVSTEFLPISTAESPGLILKSGLNPQEGAKIEFTPEQTSDLYTVFNEFIAWSVTDSPLIVDPSHVDESGHSHLLNTN